jgi:predicted aldo/keto reductase-like oxidoreductase
MEYRTLSTTDLKVSRLSFGTMTFGSSTDEAAASRIVARCLDAGMKACQGGTLDESLLARCDGVWKRLRGITPKYNR